MVMLLVSIIVPIYNVEKYVEKCIQSICNQSYKNIEIILVDDGSTDNSGTICDEYANKDKRIKVVHKKNEGLVRARKTGFSISTGELIANIDGDDWIDSEMISDCVSIYHDTQAEIIQSGLVCEGKQKDRIKYENSVDKLTDENTVFHITNWLNGKEFIYGSQLVTKIVQRDIFKRSYFKVTDDMSNGEDFISFLYYMDLAHKAVSIDKIYYHYLVREESLSHKMHGINQLLIEDHLTEKVVQVIKELSIDISEQIIENWVIKRKGFVLMKEIPEFSLHLLNFEFQDIETIIDKNVVIYGAGKVGQDIFRQLSTYNRINIVAWIDKNSEKYDFSYTKVYNTKLLKDIQYDLIIIAVQKSEMAQEIKRELLKLGINEKVIIWQEYRSFWDT